MEQRKMVYSKRYRLIARLAAGFLFLCMLAGGYVYAVYNGYVLLNHPSKRNYPVRGVDVSHYQGTIDWQVLAGEDIRFAYIKATEGSSHEDSQFQKNWQEVRQTSLKAGAYHFFSFDSEGQSQLKHFAETVQPFEGMLPPVVDVEFYADKKANPPSPEAVEPQLRTLLEGLQEHYGLQPVIYATEEAWELYLKGRFDEYPLWIRNVMTGPKIGDASWTFWQYSNRGRLDGYEGTEPFIDLNVFGGSEEEWMEWSGNTLTRAAILY